MSASVTGSMMSAAALSMMMFSGLRTARYAAGVVRMVFRFGAARYAAGIVRMVSRLSAARYTAIMVCVPVVRAVGIAVFSVVHMYGGFRTFCHIAYAMAVFSNLCAAVNAA